MYQSEVRNSRNGIPNNLFGQQVNNIVGQAITRQQLRFKNSYSNPASIQLAKIHQKATKYGYKPRSQQKDPRKARMNQKSNICGCCNFSANNEQISIWDSVQPSKENNKQFKLTQDVALFFTFIKSLIIFIVLHSIIHSAFNVISSKLGGTYCDKVQACQDHIWTKTAISNKYDRQDLITIVNILDLVAIIASIAYLGWSRRYFYKVSQNIDRSTVSQADFTIFVGNIPKIQYPKQGSNQTSQEMQSTSRQDLRVFLQSFITEGIRTSQIKRDNTTFSSFMQKSTGSRSSSKIVQSISLCYNLSQYEILHDEKWNLIWTFQNNFVMLDFCGMKIPDLFGFRSPINYQGQVVSRSNSLQDEDKSVKDGNIKRRIETNLNEEVNYNLLDVNKRNQLNEIRQKVNFINEQQIKMSYDLVKNRKLFFHNVNFSGNAFVSFQFEDFKEYIHSKYLQNPSQFIFNGVQLQIEDACDPTDVNWFNMKIPPSVRANKILFSYIVLFMLLMFSFTILFAVELLKRTYVQTQHGGVLNFVKTQGLSLLTSLIILGANSLFDFVSWFLTNLQGHATKTNYMFSHVLKTFFSRLMNTIVMYFLIAVILTKDYQQQKFLSSTGLVTQIYNFIVVSGLINLIHAFINVNDIIARVKRWFIYSYRQTGDQVFTKFQVSLNQDFQLSEFNLVYKYNDYIVTLYTALFYAYLVPIGVPTLIIIFTVQYWIDKFTLFKRSSLKNNFSYYLSIYVRRIFQSSVLMFALGNLVFSYYLEDYHVSVLNLISLGIAAVFTLCVWIAPQKIERKLFGEYQVSDVLSYSQCQQEYRFRTTYWNQNRATFCVDQRMQMSKTLSPTKSMKRNNNMRGSNQQGFI